MSKKTKQTAEERPLRQLGPGETMPQDEARLRERDPDDVPPEEREPSEGEIPVTNLSEAADAVPEGRTAVSQVQHPAVTPVGQVEVPDNVTRQPAVSVAGTPSAQLRPETQRFGVGGPAGETQPGILPPGEAERAIDDSRLAALDDGPAEGEEAVSLENGVLRVGERLVLPMQSCEIEFRGRGDKLEAKIETASGSSHKLRGKSARQLQQLAGRR
jgi:hypothetical protein